MFNKAKKFLSLVLLHSRVVIIKQFTIYINTIVYKHMGGEEGEVYMELGVA